MKISDNTSISMPMRNLLSILAAVAIGVWAYFGVTEKLNQHSTSLTLIKKEMEDAIDEDYNFSVPLIVDVNSAKNWSDAH